MYIVIYLLHLPPNLNKSVELNRRSCRRELLSLPPAPNRPLGGLLKSSKSVALLPDFGEDTRRQNEKPHTVRILASYWYIYIYWLVLYCILLEEADKQI